MVSVAVRFRIEKDADDLWLSVDLADLTHDMAARGEKIATPRVFLGLAHGDRDRRFTRRAHYMQRPEFSRLSCRIGHVGVRLLATDGEGVQDALPPRNRLCRQARRRCIRPRCPLVLGFCRRKARARLGCGLGRLRRRSPKFDGPRRESHEGARTAGDENSGCG